jgi:hypothetical protein
MAYATERIFEALLILDTVTETGSSRGLAATEDVAWFNDYEQLRGAGDLGKILQRSGTIVQRIVEFRQEKGLP